MNLTLQVAAFYMAVVGFLAGLVGLWLSDKYRQEDQALNVATRLTPCRSELRKLKRLWDECCRLHEEATSLHESLKGNTDRNDELELPCFDKATQHYNKIQRDSEQLPRKATPDQIERLRADCEEAIEHIGEARSETNAKIAAMKRSIPARAILSKRRRGIEL